MSNRLRLHRELVDGWLYWCVFTLAREVSKDVALCVRTAQHACVQLWEDSDDD